MKMRLGPHENASAERDSRLIKQASYIIKLHKNRTYRQRGVDILSAVTVERILGCLPQQIAAADHPGLGRPLGWSGGRSGHRHPVLQRDPGGRQPGPRREGGP